MLLIRSLKPSLLSYNHFIFYFEGIPSVFYLACFIHPTLYYNTSVFHILCNMSLTYSLAVTPRWPFFVNFEEPNIKTVWKVCAYLFKYQKSLDYMNKLVQASQIYWRTDYCRPCHIDSETLKLWSILPLSSSVGKIHGLYLLQLTQFPYIGYDFDVFCSILYPVLFYTFPRDWPTLWWLMLPINLV